MIIVTVVVVESLLPLQVQSPSHEADEADESQASNDPLGHDATERARPHLEQAGLSPRHWKCAEQQVNKEALCSFVCFGCVCVVVVVCACVWWWAGDVDCVGDGDLKIRKWEMSITD